MSETQTADLDAAMDELMKFTPQQRLELAARLTESVPPAFDDPEIAEAWGKEIARRVKEAKEGRVKPIPADEVHARIERKYGISSE